MDQRKGRVKEKEAKIILFQIVQGLAEIHSKKIAHRDIKPSKIFMAKKYFKIGDFDFATNKSKFTSKCGTKSYMAPEILSD